MLVLHMRCVSLILTTCLIAGFLCSGLYGERMFGLTLSPDAASLKTEVERSFTKTIREERLDEDIFLSPAASLQAQSSIEPDGTPVVRINTSRGVTERTIVHELFHLKLRAEGFPSPVFDRRQPEVANLNIESLWNMLRDPIEHAIFFPKMRELGYDPDADVRADLEKAMRDGDFADPAPLSKQDFLTLLYFKALLEVTDTELLSRLNGWYSAKGWTRAIEIAEKLKQAVTDSPLQTRQQQIDAIVGCLNILFEDSFAFSFRRWITRKLGSFVQTGAVIDIAGK